MAGSHAAAIAAKTRARFPAQLRDDARLELVRRAHAEGIYRLVDKERARLGEWLPWVNAVTGPEDTRAWVASCQRLLSAGKGFNLVLVCDGAAAGTVGSVIDWENRSAQLGYWLGRRAEGKGLMTGACSLLVRHAFDDLALHRVEIRCATANARSRSIPERLGFRQEGVLRDAERFDGRYVDLVVYGLLSGDPRGSV